MLLLFPVGVCERGVRLESVVGNGREQCLRNILYMHGNTSLRKGNNDGYRLEYISSRRPYRTVEISIF